MKNADKFKTVFGLYATELWSMPEREFLKWLNSENTEIEQRWIPCSERLPEETDYKGCSECIDGAVWYYTDKGAMGLGYYYESTKAWSTTYDECPYGEVIAWMPLPEPYKEGEQK